MIDLRERVAIVTGAGRGIGRAYALRLAAYGARVVVNDAGVATDGSSTAEDPAADVVAEITSAGGEAIAQRGDIGDARVADELVQRALDSWGTARHRHQQRGLRPAAHGLQPRRRRVGRRDPRSPARDVRGVTPACRYWRAGEGARHDLRPADQHGDRTPALRRRRPVELRRRQGGHQRVHRGRRDGDGALRRHRELDHAGRQHALGADRLADAALDRRRRRHAAGAGRCGTRSTWPSSAASSRHPRRPGSPARRSRCTAEPSSTFRPGRSLERGSATIAASPPTISPVSCPSTPGPKPADRPPPEWTAARKA